MLGHPTRGSAFNIGWTLIIIILRTSDTFSHLHDHWISFTLNWHKFHSKRDSTLSRFNSDFWIYMSSWFRRYKISSLSWISCDFSCSLKSTFSKSRFAIIIPYSKPRFTVLISVCEQISTLLWKVSSLFYSGFFCCSVWASSLTSKLCTVQKVKFSITDFFSKCDQIRRKLRIWSHLLKKSVMENFIFCAVMLVTYPWMDFCSFNKISDYFHYKQWFLLTFSLYLNEVSIY